MGFAGFASGRQGGKAVSTTEGWGCCSAAGDGTSSGVGVKVPWLCGLGRGAALSWMDRVKCWAWKEQGFWDPVKAPLLPTWGLPGCGMRTKHIGLPLRGCSETLFP